MGRVCEWWDGVWKGCGVGTVDLSAIIVYSCIVRLTSLL